VATHSWSVLVIAKNQFKGQHAQELGLYSKFSGYSATIAMNIHPCSIKG